MLSASSGYAIYKPSYQGGFFYKRLPGRVEPGFVSRCIEVSVLRRADGAIILGNWLV